jgi:hypothetical protein
MVRGQARQKGSKILSKTNRAWWLIPVFPVTWEKDVRGSPFKTSLNKSTRPYLKTKTKKDWGHALSW